MADIASVFLHGEGSVVTRRSDAQGFRFLNSIKSFARRRADTKGRAERRGDENIANPHDSLRKVSCSDPQNRFSFGGPDFLKGETERS